MHGKHEIDWGWSKLTMGGAFWQLVHILLCVCFFGELILNYQCSSIIRFLFNLKILSYIGEGEI